MESYEVNLRWLNIRKSLSMCSVYEERPSALIQRKGTLFRTDLVVPLRLSLNCLRFPQPMQECHSS
jgi:hypothetical protein